MNHVIPLTFACVLGLSANRTLGDSLIPVGSPAPSFALPALDGQTVEVGALKGRTVLLLFGELYNPNSISAAKELEALLAKPALSDAGVTTYMLVTQKATPAELADQADRLGVTFSILHDPERRVFGAYHVVVLPSVVVFDDQGLTLLSCAGYPLGLMDMISDALLSAGAPPGRPLKATSQPAVDKAQTRAQRLAMLGQQLARRGSDELAIHTFEEALSVDAHCVAAEVGLGGVLVRRRELAEAERHFRRAMEFSPDSVDAALGLIHIQVRRGGSELKSAEQQVRELLGKRPNDARVLYATAVVAEKAGDINAALGFYRRAAEEALFGQGAARGQE
jgi:tetratricopeptide (TPR) repeat protein